MGDFLQPWHLIVLAVVAFLLFGAKRLPELGKGLGQFGLAHASGAYEKQDALGHFLLFRVL